MKRLRMPPPTSNLSIIPDSPDEESPAEEEIDEMYILLEVCLKKLDKRSRIMIELSADGVKDKTAAELLGFSSYGYYRIALMRIKAKLLDCIERYKSPQK